MPDPADGPDSMTTIPDSPCPRCDGSGLYQNFPSGPVRDCAVCDGTGVCPVAPSQDGPPTEELGPDDIVDATAEAVAVLHEET